MYHSPWGECLQCLVRMELDLAPVLHRDVFSFQHHLQRLQYFSGDQCGCLVCLSEAALHIAKWPSLGALGTPLSPAPCLCTNLDLGRDEAVTFGYAEARLSHLYQPGNHGNFEIV